MANTLINPSPNTLTPTLMPHVEVSDGARHVFEGSSGEDNLSWFV